MVAALAYAEAQGLSEEEAVRLSTAAGAANVMCSGTQAAEREAVEALLPKVRFSRLRRERRRRRQDTDKKTPAHRKSG